MGTVQTSVATLFCIIFAGFFLGKANIIRKDAIQDFSVLAIHIAMPATIFLLVIRQMQGQDNLRDFFFMILVSVMLAGSFLFMMLAVRIFRVPAGKRGVWYFNSIFTNNAYIGFPLALTLFGSRVQFIMVLANTVTNILFFSLGTKLLTANVPGARKLSQKEMFLTNLNIAVAAGLLFAFFHIPLPVFAENALSYLGNITSGLSMLVVGLSLSRMELKMVFADRSMYILTAIRLLILPALVAVFLRLCPLKPDPVFTTALVLTAALPSASAQTMLAEQYHGDIKGTNQAVFLTTMFSAVTVPLMLKIGIPS